jgi:hypothetical protein
VHGLRVAQGRLAARLDRPRRCRSRISFRWRCAAASPAGLWWLPGTSSGAPSGDSTWAGSRRPRTALWNGLALRSERRRRPPASSRRAGLHAYGAEELLTSRTLDGDQAAAVQFSYDNDGLLTQAGNLQLYHDAGNGLLVGTHVKRHLPLRDKATPTVTRVSHGGAGGGPRGKSRESGCLPPLPAVGGAQAGGGVGAGRSPSHGRRAKSMSWTITPSSPRRARGRAAGSSCP